MRSLLIVGALFAMGACARDEPPGRVDSATTMVAETPVRPRWTGSWPRELGDMLLVPADTPNAAFVIYPDEISDASASAGSVLLVGSADSSVTRALKDSLQCEDAPAVRLDSAPSDWLVGFRGHTASVIRADSIEALSSRDSATLVVALSRIASTLTPPGENRFQGLPFAVTRARRFDAFDRRVLIGQLVRRLPLEASPLEEHTFVIAEKAADAPDSGYALAYSNRAEGTEERVDHVEVLAVIRGASSVMVLLARDREARTDYSLFERTAGEGKWRIRWTRPVRC
jgi:hypothetical protein